MLCDVCELLYIDFLGKSCEYQSMPKSYKSNVGQVDELLTKHELAKKLKCTGRSVDNYVSRGLFKRIKVGNLSRFNWESVRQALENQN